MTYRKYAKSFYDSTVWKRCKDGYMQSQNYICERCGKFAEICHHKIYLNAENINDPNITLNWELLEALCQTCHNQEHHSKGIISEGLAFDSEGNVIQVTPPLVK